MTVRQVYEQSVKPLSPTDRAELADLILDDLDIELAEHIQDKEQLMELLREGFVGEPVPVNAETWARLRRRIESS
jgi:hypothetical protein